MINWARVLFVVAVVIVAYFIAVGIFDFVHASAAIVRVGRL